MSKQLEKLEERKKRLEDRIKQERKKQRARTKKRDQKRLEAMGRYVRNNDELFRRFINEGAPKLPAYLKSLFQEEIAHGGPLPKGRGRKPQSAKTTRRKSKASK